MHAIQIDDSDLVTFDDHSLVIGPYGSSKQSWRVKAHWDHEHCNATVNFNVPGKPSPPPVNLTATLYQVTGSTPPHANSSATATTLVFTDPTGTLAKAGYPLNAWVQIDADEPAPGL